MSVVSSDVNLTRYSTTQRLLLVATAILASVIPSEACFARQDGEGAIARTRPIPVRDYHVWLWDGLSLIGLQGEANRPGPDGQPTVAPRERRFYYLPLFALKQIDGEPQVDFDEDTGRVTINVVMDSPLAREKFTQHLIEENLLDEDPTQGQVQIISARRFQVEVDSRDYPIPVIFGPYDDHEFTRLEQPLSVHLPGDAGARFVNDLKAGLALRATVVFQGYGFQENRVTISFRDIRETRAFREIDGRGPRGTVSRKGISNLLHETVTNVNIIVSREFHDPDFDQLVQHVLRLLDRERVNLDAEWTALGEEFRRRNWDPDDLRADVIATSQRRSRDRGEAGQKLHTILKDTIAQNRNVGGGFGFKGFSLNATHNNQEQREHFRDVMHEVGMEWDIEFEENIEGNIIVPKSIFVYSNDLSALRREGTFAIGDRRILESVGKMSVQMGSTTHSAFALEDRVERLNMEISRLRDELREMAATAEQEFASVKRDLADIQQNANLLKRTIDKHGDALAGLWVPQIDAGHIAARGDSRRHKENDWREDGDRRFQSRTVRFARQFREPPTVFISTRKVEANTHASNYRHYHRVSDVRRDRFTITWENWGSGYHIQAESYWIAIGR